MDLIYSEVFVHVLTHAPTLPYLKTKTLIFQTNVQPQC